MSELIRISHTHKGGLFAYALLPNDLLTYYPHVSRYTLPAFHFYHSCTLVFASYSASSITGLLMFQTILRPLELLGLLQCLAVATREEPKRAM